ncbi:hypothetical protein Acy02nite_92320 [Actinoplanes cyaneus]|uniref:Hemerythrin-like domain-containing protein n=1 Tax=Actinoplanes cyaneus TaxID=52696 RepID=A0A919IUP3_9ACTN|nr:hemerythrin domain-containing protein [Actinoplanes cyaneus]MCW2144581.1 Hemerythrin HHE cation binding domain-containing protein [Actinoplanes cyaneus]GID71351.1 hypothetical protein Acy02nite_92320 [Actinoplanes cyaneus]
MAVLLDPNAPADKPQTDEMKVIHKALRREFELLGRVVAAVPAGDLATAATVARHAGLMLGMLHEHHDSEDTYIWPLLHQRDSLDDALIDTVERQHEAIAAAIGRIEPDLRTWSSEAQPAVRDALSARFTALSEALVQHLDLEEERVLPLIHEHLTVAEWKAPQVAAMRNGPKDFTSLMLLAGVVLEGASPAERRWFMREMPPPARLIWRIVGVRMYAAHVRAVRAPLSHE